MSSSPNLPLPSDPMAVSDEAAVESSIASSSSSSAQRPIDDCPMLRLLSLDSGSMFQLLRFLPLLSMASLYASCRRWSKWLRVGGKIVRRYRPVKPSRFHELKGSWVQMHITQLNLILESPDLSAPDDATQQAQLNAMLAVVNEAESFPRLVGLELYCAHSSADAALVRMSLASLGPRLHTLFIFPSQRHSEELVNAFMSSLDAVPALTELKITGQFSGRAIDISLVPQLKSLRTFQLISQPAMSWIRTPAQNRLLAQCVSLINIHMGSYGLADPGVDDGLCELIDARVATGTADLVEWLHLSHSKLTRAGFEALMRLPSLRSICPIVWAPDLTPAHWAQLPKLSQLEQISVGVSHVDNADPANLRLSLDMFIDPLTQCSKLNTIQLAKMNVSTAQLIHITTSLQHLARLTLADLRMESVEPLRLAPKLAQLRLLHCLDAKGEFVQFRSALPPLLHLTELFLQDLPRFLLTREEAAPLNDALLARMPELRMDKFVQIPTPK